MRQVNQSSPYPPDCVGADEVRRMPPSQRRYIADDTNADVDPITQCPPSSIPRRRASRSDQSTGTSLRRRETKTEEFFTTQTERLSPHRQPQVIRKGTQPSRAVKPFPRQQQFDRPLLWKTCLRHPLAAAGGGMCTALFLVVVGWHLTTWYANILGDPLAYTQSSDRNTARVTIAGHHAQVYAFIDTQKHLDAVVIPDGNGKPQLLTGKEISFAHPMVSVNQENDGDITVTVQGQYDDNWFWPQRPTTQNWTLSLDQKPQGQK